MNIKIDIENFKSIVSTSLELKRGLNVLIGQNGAGKTSILNSLKFIRDVLHRGVGLAIAKGGGPSRLYYRGKERISFKIEFDYEHRVVKNRKREAKFFWVFAIEQKGKEKLATITYERIQVTAIVDGKNEVIFSLEVERKNLEKPVSSFSLNENLAGKDILNILTSEYGNKSKQKMHESLNMELNDIMSKFKKNGDRSLLSILFSTDKSLLKFFRFFSSLNEYNIIPERARQATEQVPFAKMQPNGYGISEVIDALEKKNFHKLTLASEIDDFEYPSLHRNRYYYWRNDIFQFSRMSRKNIEHAFGRINSEIAMAVKPITGVTVKIDDSTGRRFVVFKTGKNQFFPDEVSDGTIKWLCIVASIYVGFSSIYLLEEPENFLHPWMQQKLVQIMREQANESDTIFLLTSHSTTLLNSCFPNELRIVETSSEGTKIRNIENEDEVLEFLNQSDFRLGDLWVSGGIGAIPE